MVLVFINNFHAEEARTTTPRPSEVGTGFAPYPVKVRKLTLATP